eukprot:1516_1
MALDQPIHWQHREASSYPSQSMFHHVFPSQLFQFNEMVVMFVLLLSSSVILPTSAFKGNADICYGHANHTTYTLSSLLSSTTTAFEHTAIPSHVTTGTSDTHSVNICTYDVLGCHETYSHPPIHQSSSVSSPWIEFSFQHIVSCILYAHSMPQYASLYPMIFALSTVANAQNLTLTPSMAPVIPRITGSNIYCTGIEQCKYFDITCLDYQNCHVQCGETTGQYACAYANIYCPSSSGNCSVDCSSHFACSTVHIYGGGEGLVVRSTLNYAMYHATIDCPNHHICSFTSYSIGDSYITINGNEASILNFERQGGDGTPGDAAIGTINCPYQGECNILCGRNAWHKTCHYNINAQTASILNIQVQNGNPNSTTGLGDVRCPIDGIKGNSNTCNIFGYNPNSYRLLEDVHIYAVEGLTDVNLTCIGSCFIETNPTIYCKEGFDDSCTITSISDDHSKKNNWQCVEDNHADCENYLYPTDVPIPEPTFATTNSPTEHPTVSPQTTTIGPTKPTSSPTAAPSTSVTYSISTRRPKDNSSVKCGKTEDCTIICDTSNACESVTVHVSTNLVSILCTGASSCLYMTITSVYVPALNITATGIGSLSNATIVIDSTNGNVYTLCSADNACTSTTFFYQNNQSVTHTCRGEDACAGAMIHAATTIQYHSDRDHKDALGLNSLPIHVIWPTETILIQQSKWLQYSQSLQILFLANTQIMPNFTCFADDICATQIIYGTTFAQHCLYSQDDDSCSHAILWYDEPYDAGAIQHRYQFFEPETLVFEANTIITVLHPIPLNESIVFASNDDDIHISMICIYCINAAFDLSSISRVTMTVIDALRDSVIVGPQDVFLFNSMPHSVVSGNVYELEMTKNAVFNGLQECPSDELYDISVIYLGDESDIEINDAIIQQCTWCCDMICKEEQTLASCEDKCEEGTIIYSTQGTEWIQLKRDEEKQCIIFEEEMPESTDVISEDSTDHEESELNSLVAIIGGCVVAVVALVVCFALCSKCIGCMNKLVDKNNKMKCSSQNEPGSGSLQRTSTKDLDVNEKVKDGEDNAEEESLVDDAKEGDGEDLEGNMVLNRQQTDERVAVSAKYANKGDKSTAGTQSGDGEGLDEVRQWLESSGLSQYYDNFVKNGMNDLELIKTIENKDDLAYLGIELKGHQIAMMKKINELKTGPCENRLRSQTPYDSAAHLEVIGDDQEDKDKENEDQSIEQKEDIVLDNMLSEVLEMQKANPDKIHQMNVDAAVDQKENVSDSDESDHMYQKSENK